MSEWMDISTAPKDGTRVDLWAAERRRYVSERITDCWFMDGQWVHHRTIYDPETPDDLAFLYNVTHWMPLPNPPSAAGESK